MLGVNTKKCKIVQEGTNVFRITLIQGLNRQIRRMCEHFGYEVQKLERVRIMNIGLKGLPLGEWRDLTDEEMDVIYGLLEGSSNEDVSKTQKKTTQNKAKTPSQPSNARTSKSTTPRSPARGTAHRKTDKKNVSRKSKPRK